jgi:hypothetical protein
MPLLKKIGWVDARRKNAELLCHDWIRDQNADLHVLRLKEFPMKL